MSLNHHTPPLAPGPLCAIFTPQLALLALGKLDPEHVAEVRSHLADCEYCQAHLRQYEIVREAFARHVGVEAFPSPDVTRPGARGPFAAHAAPRPFTLEDIMQAANKPEASAPTTQVPARLLDRSRARRRLTALGAIAAVLVLAVLAASLFAYLGSRGLAPASKPTATPGLDAQSQAYLAMLRTYYAPVGADYGKVLNCTNVYTGESATQFLQQCQPDQTTLGADAQALGTHLTVTPPARWQGADTAFKHFVPQVVPLASRGTTATSASGLFSIEGQEETVAAPVCDAVNQINLDLAHAGVPVTGLLPGIPHSYDSCSYLIEATVTP